MSGLPVVIHFNRPAFGGTIPLSDDLSRCPAFSIFVPLAPIQRENVKKLSASVQNSYKIFSLNNDQINIKSSIFYLLFIVNISQKVHTSVCLSNIILLSFTSITIILSRQLIYNSSNIYFLARIKVISAI